MNRQFGVRLLAAAVCFAIGLPAAAWDKRAHEVVATVAKEQLSPAARALVVELLGNDNLFRVAARVDQLSSRGATYRFLREWTYVAIPIGKEYDRARDCPDGECLVAAVDSFAAAVSDRSLSKEQRAVALVLLVQLVGDIQQPFHCVKVPVDDVGASRTKVHLGNRVISLHSAWDGAVSRTGLDDDVLRVAARIQSQARKDTPAEWASVQSSAAAANFVPQGSTIDPADLRAKVPLHLAYASVRLAWLLDRAAKGPIQRTEPRGPNVPNIPLDVLLGTAATTTTPSDDEDEGEAEPTTTTGTATTTSNPPVPPPKPETKPEPSLTDRALKAAAAAVGAYILGIAALLLLTWRRGSTLISRSWLWRAAIYPIRINPIVGRWLLFLGYRRRLGQRQAVQKVADGYFGLPAVTSTQQTIVSDETGDALHREIAALTANRLPLFIVGPGGAGKSTLLARLAWLGMHDRLPNELRGMTPVLVSAVDYSGDVLSTIATTLRDRDAVDMPDDPDARREILQSGRFLILFDGLSEIAGDREKALRELVATAQTSDFAASRFIVATRPGLEELAHQQTVELRPLAPAVIRELIERLHPPVATKNRVLLQLESLGDKPIEPLLFRMMLGEGEDGTSSTRSELYERYFRTLLQIGRNNQAWRGWEVVLGEIASAFLLVTGKRGAGMRHEELLDFLRNAGKDESLSQRMGRLYGINVAGELALANRLESAGILTMDRRWRFSHDTFEEYFAAAHIIAVCDATGTWPPLWEWLSTEERRRDFLKILDFVREKADAELVRTLAAADIPPLWRERLTSGT